MSCNNVTVKFYDARVILNFNINAIFISIFNKFGDNVKLNFMIMDEHEKQEATLMEQGIALVQDRFYIFEEIQPCQMIRRSDVEQLAIATARGGGVSPEERERGRAGTGTQLVSTGGAGTERERGPS